MLLGYSRTQNHTDDNFLWDKQESFENNYLRQTTAQNTSETIQLSASRAFVMRDWVLSTSVGVFHRNDNGNDNDDNGIYLTLSLSDTPAMDSNNNSHSTNVTTDYRHSDQDGDQTSWQVSHTFITTVLAIKSWEWKWVALTPTPLTARFMGDWMVNTAISTVRFLTVTIVMSAIISPHLPERTVQRLRSAVTASI